MIWTIIFIVIAFALLIVAGYLFSKPEGFDEPVSWGVICIIGASIIILLCSWLMLYNKGLEKGYPTSLDNIPSDQIYKFFGQVQGSEKFVVILENAKGKIRCVTVPEAIDPNTQYLKRVIIVEETTVKRQKEQLVPVSEETSKK